MITLLFAIIGLTIIVTQSSIFKPVRMFLSKRSKYLGDLVSCSLCFGFFAGIICFFLNKWQYSEFIFYGFIGAIISWTYTKIIYWFEK